MSKEIKNTFGIPIIPENDEERLARLFDYEILDTLPENAFNHVASIAAHMFKVPIALISFVDRDRVWYKANVGMEGVKEVSRGKSLCSLVILNDEVTVFENAPTEPCLLANPFVAGEFGLQFYAGAPIKTKEGLKIGAVALIDKEPRLFGEADQKVLDHLASIVMDELELRFFRKSND